MSIKEHTTPERLEKYAFMWGEIRLILGAIALFLGGVPVIYKLGLYGLGNLLTIFWVISGIASAYLLYAWNKNGRTVFGGKETRDTVAFFIQIVTGFNLGIAGLLGTNIGMEISSSRLVFIVTGILYLVTMYYLCKRWKENNQRLF